MDNSFWRGFLDYVYQSLMHDASGNQLKGAKLAHEVATAWVNRPGRLEATTLALMLAEKAEEIIMPGTQQGYVSYQMNVLGAFTLEEYLESKGQPLPAI